MIDIVNAAIEAHVNDLITFSEARDVALRWLGIEKACEKSAAPKQAGNTTIDNVRVWSAHNSPARPICLATDDDSGYSVNVYSGDEGIEGVAVYDCTDLVGVIGNVPKEAL